MKPCYICKSSDFEIVNGKVRDMPELKILRCLSCGLVFLESFDHIDDRFYNQSKMREFDDNKEWQLHINECSNDDSRRNDMMKPLIINKSVLDFGCGGGGFLIKIKDFTSTCQGIEKDDYFKQSLNNEFGIKVYDDVDECHTKFDFITMFHVLEHLKDPKSILIRLSKLLNNGGNLIIEVPNADDALLTLYKNKPFSEFTYWSCHLFLFNNSTLRQLIESTGLKINYIKQIQRYPISNHLYWLSNGLPGGHKKWDFLDDKTLNSQYQLSLANLGVADTIIASVSK